MTTQEKSKVICERVGIELAQKVPSKKKCSGKVKLYSWQSCQHKGAYTYKKKIYCWRHLPVEAVTDFFHPDIKERRNAQAILAQALLKKRNFDLKVKFFSWCVSHPNRLAGNSYEDTLTIIAETKLASLSLEFIESEVKDG